MSQQVGGVDYYGLSQDAKRQHCELYRVHSRSANITVAEAIDRLRMSGDRLEAAIQRATGESPAKH
jgi:hypothetical protein